MTTDWTIVGVFNPDGTGRDFAYTVGLHDHGLPELFLWARPTDGDDPGADWLLSQLDLAHQLNDLGDQLVAGAIAPGDTIEVTYDRGTTHATLDLQPPVPAHGSGLDAFQTHPDATVCNVRWTMRRTPVGPRRPLTPDEVERARARLAILLGVEAATGASFAATAPFGPNTAAFEALRSRARAMDDNRAAHLVAAIHLGPRPEGELGLLQEAARQVGLVDELRRATDLAIADSHAICRRAFADDRTLARSAGRMFDAVLGAAYGTEVVRHAASAEATGCSEIVWTLLDPEGGHTQRFVDAVSRVDVALGLVLQRPSIDALARTVDGLSAETLGALAGLWPLAAVDGHGSGLWLTTRLVRSVPDLARFEEAARAADALAIAGYLALGIRVPQGLDDAVGDDLAALAAHITADVRSTALPRAS